jgi:hypothetical protein
MGPIYKLNYEDLCEIIDLAPYKLRCLPTRPQIGNREIDSSEIPKIAIIQATILALHKKGLLKEYPEFIFKENI